MTEPVEVAVQRAVDEVRELGLEAGLLQSDGKVSDQIVILTALMLMKDRLVRFNKAGDDMPNPVRMPPKKAAKSQLTV